jgi:hypothetical protein
LVNKKETDSDISPDSSRRKANERKESRHCFSIELKSKEFLRNLMISNRTGETVLLEGFLGELEEMSLVEGGLLEVTGSNGVLRMDLNEEDLETLLTRLAPRIVKKGGTNENRSARYPEVEQSAGISRSWNGDLR